MTVSVSSHHWEKLFTATPERVTVVPAAAVNVADADVLLLLSKCPKDRGHSLLVLWALLDMLAVERRSH
jgi:hypothetical protein